MTNMSRDLRPSNANPRQHCGLITHEFVNRETAMLSSQPNLSLKENTNFILKVFILVLLKVDSEIIFFSGFIKGRSDARPVAESPREFGEVLLQP